MKLNIKLGIVLSFFLLIFSGCSSGSEVVSEVNGTLNVNITESVDFQNIPIDEFYFRLARGEFPQYSTIHKFGAGELTTIPRPITQSGTYMTPMTPVALEFVSDNAADTFLGAGARQIFIDCLNATWEMEPRFIINTSGTTPVPLPISCLRLYRWGVYSSGTYASPTAASHVGELEIRELGNGPTWSIVTNSPIPTGQSQIGAVTVPKGKTAYLNGKVVFTDTSKTADIYFFQRCKADDITAPYEGTRRLIEREVGVTGGFSLEITVPKGPYVGPCDLGFLGVVGQGVAEVSVEFELILEDTQ